MKYLLIFLLVLAIFVISVTLGAQNDQQVTFNYLLAQGEYRISTLLAVLFAAGFAIGWLICGLFWLKVRVSLAHFCDPYTTHRQRLQVKAETTTPT